MLPNKLRKEIKTRADALHEEMKEDTEKLKIEEQSFFAEDDY